MKNTNKIQMKNTNEMKNTNKNNGFVPLFLFFLGY